MNLETVTGIVLSAMPIGEYDKRLVLLTKELGRISAFAKGARRSNSALMASSQPFAFGTFTLYRGRNSYSVNHAEIQNYFEGLKEDLEKISYASYFCEVAAYLTYENMEATGILKLLYQSLRAIGHEKIPNDLIKSVFELKAISYNGEMPQVFSCVKCRRKQKDLHEVFYGGFSSKSGGMICKECKHTAKDLLEISPATVYTLQHIVSSPVEKLYTFLLAEEYKNELRKVAEQYMEQYAKGEYHSLEMLKLLEG